MDYSKLSDFEINAAVECEMDESFRFMEFDEETDEFIYCDPTGENCQRIKPRDYCNNPSDAWPIILENEISLTKESESLNVNWHADVIERIREDAVNESLFTCETSLHHYNENPLRAAMIVYLMMQEDK